MSNDPRHVLLKESQARSYLQISRTTLWRLRRSGQLPAVNIGRSVRYRLSDVIALTKKDEVEI